MDPPLLQHKTTIQFASHYNKMRIQRNKEKKRLEAEGNGEKVLEDSTSEVDTSSSEQGATTIRAHSNRGTTTDVLYAEKENNSRMMGCHSTKHYAQVQCGLIEFD